jgi:hypothetical protein
VDTGEAWDRLGGPTIGGIVATSRSIAGHVEVYECHLRYRHRGPQLPRPDLGDRQEDVSPAPDGYA